MVVSDRLADETRQCSPRLCVFDPVLMLRSALRYSDGPYQRRLVRVRVRMAKRHRHPDVTGFRAGAAFNSDGRGRAEGWSNG